VDSTYLQQSVLIYKLKAPKAFIRSLLSKARGACGHHPHTSISIQKESYDDEDAAEVHKSIPGEKSHATNRKCFFGSFFGSDAGSWKVIIPFSGLSMQGGREEFHYQVFSLVTDREVLKKFEKSSHVRLRTIFISAIKMREKILIRRRHSSGISRDFTHI
jgi:hypothetical protein